MVDFLMISERYRVEPLLNPTSGQYNPDVTQQARSHLLRNLYAFTVFIVEMWRTRLHAFFLFSIVMATALLAVVGDLKLWLKTE